jgi:hypothetical protein
MLKNILCATALFVTAAVSAQINIPKDSIPVNTAGRLLAMNQKLSIGGYGQIDFNQPFVKNQKSSANLDVHRMVLMFGYKFNNRTNFITELEMEHVSEVYVEQAFLQYRINDYANFRAGLMLVPMGIVNEYHEPTTFNGVERPNLDKYIVPSTWREIGAGLTGNVKELSVKYQLYLMNGFSGENSDGSATFSGKNGLRKGRQKGAESYMSSANLATKFDFYGIRGLKLGLSGYFGKSQSNHYEGVNEDDTDAMKSADSTVIGISMIGVDARYKRRGLQLRGQFNYASMSNTDQYNGFYGSNMGSSMMGYFAEIGYNVLNKLPGNTELVPFVRYEKYNTHNSVESGTSKNAAYDRTDITFGLGWKITPGSVLKMDYQIMSDEDKSTEDKGMFNMGVGVWF